MRSIALAVVAVACGAPAKPAAPSQPPQPSPLVAARPYDVHVPPSYDKTKATPLVVVLHGYTLDAKKQDQYLRISEVADREGFLVALPDGTLDGGGNRFWNATDACCDLGGTKVDDVAYLTAVLDDVAAKYNVDAKRVYLVGHSNGAFMSHRLACELAPRIAAIATLAGVQWLDAGKCKASAKVSVAQIHGDADQLILFGGGALDNATLDALAKLAGMKMPKLTDDARTYPSAKQTVAAWAKLDGCSGALAKTGELDLDAELAGAETEVQAFGGCAGVAVELWTIRGGSHGPSFAPAPAAPAFADAVFAFFTAHPHA